MPILLLLAVVAAESERIVVFDLGAKHEAAANIARELSEVLVGSVREAAPGAKVVGQSELKAMLNLEEQKQAVGCADDAACLAEIGGALGAGRLVTGHLGKVGEVFVLSIKMIDTARAEVVGHFTDRIDGPEELLLEAVTQGTRHLMDPAAPVRHGYVSVDATGRVFVDGVEVGPGPGRFPAVAGNRLVVIKNADGDELASYEVAVAPYTTVAVAGAEIADNNGGGGAWYQKWWVWTLAGVAVAGGVGTAIALGSSGGDDGSTSAEVHVDLGDWGNP